MKVVRNELVEALITFVNKIKLDDAVDARRLFPDYFKRLKVLFEYRLEPTLHFSAGCDFFERLRRQITNDPLDERVVRISLDYLHQLQRGLFQLDTLRRRLVKRAIDHVRPVDQRFDRLGVELETFVRDVSNKFRA